MWRPSPGWLWTLQRLFFPCCKNILSSLIWAIASKSTQKHFDWIKTITSMFVFVISEKGSQTCCFHNDKKFHKFYCFLGPIVCYKLIRLSNWTLYEHFLHLYSESFSRLYSICRSSKLPYSCSTMISLSHWEFGYIIGISFWSSISVSPIEDMW